MSKIPFLKFDEQDLQCLIRGGILHVKDANLQPVADYALDNISYGKIYNMVNRAEDKLEPEFEGREKVI